MRLGVTFALLAVSALSCAPDEVVIWSLPPASGTGGVVASSGAGGASSGTSGSAGLGEAAGTGGILLEFRFFGCRQIDLRRGSDDGFGVTRNAGFADQRQVFERVVLRFKCGACAVQSTRHAARAGLHRRKLAVAGKEIKRARLGIVDL